MYSHPSVYDLELLSSGIFFKGPGSPDPCLYPLWPGKILALHPQGDKDVGEMEPALARSLTHSL